MIDVKNLSKSFGDHLVLDDISEHIYPGEKHAQQKLQGKADLSGREFRIQIPWSGINT